jgi:hypothetical protein
MRDAARGKSSGTAFLDAAKPCASGLASGLCERPVYGVMP